MESVDRDHPEDRGRVVHKADLQKNEDTRNFLHACLRKSRFCLLLDADQLERMVDTMELTEFDAGQDLVLQGSVGDTFYVIEDGECDVLRATSPHIVESTESHSRHKHHDTSSSRFLSHDISSETAQPALRGFVLEGTLRRSNYFGESAFLFRTKNSRGVRTTQPCRVWSMSRSVFERQVLLSDSVRERFLRHASAVDRTTGMALMTREDFVRSLRHSDTAALPVAAPSVSDATAHVDSFANKLSAGAQTRLRYLFNLVDRDRKGALGLVEFAWFTALMGDSDAEFNIIFMLFDHNKRGEVGVDDVKMALSTQSVGFDVDFNTTFFVRFFGPNLDRRLRFYEFSQFYASLQPELFRQLFERHDPDKQGFISRDGFCDIIARIAEWRLPVALRDLLLERGGLVPFRKFVTFGEFVAFNRVLDRLDELVDLIDSSRIFDSRKRTTGVTKGEVNEILRRSRFVHLSPLEIEIFFALANVGSAEMLTHEHFARLRDYAHSLRGIPVSTVGGEGQVLNQLERGMGAASHAHDSSSPGHGASAISGGSGALQKTLSQKIIGWTIELVEHFAMGYVAGGIGATVVYPIDLVKTRMQNQRNVGQGTLYRNSFQCARHVLMKEGVFAFYRGLLPQLVGVAPEKAIKISVNNMLRSFFAKENDEIDLPLEVLAGCGAGASQVVFTNPLEIVKIRLQLQGEMPVATRQTARQIVKELGFMGLYRGAAACLMRDVPFSGIYFPAYAAMKEMLADNDGRTSWGGMLLAGAVAGIPAASLVTPADVIKTRLQVKAKQGDVAYKGIADCFRRIVQEEGVAALFKGAGMRMFRSCPQFGVTLLVFEFLQSKLGPLTNTRFNAPTNAPVSKLDMERARRGAILDRWEQIDRSLHVIHAPPRLTADRYREESEN